MAPSAAELSEALLDGTCEVYKAEPDGTSVNKVRRHVEQKLGLEDGFFVANKWKDKSKTIIKEQVDKLLDAASEPNSEPETKSAIKRQSSEAESPEPKRRKRALQAPKESEAKEARESRSKPRVKKATAHRKAKAFDLYAGDLTEEKTKSKVKKTAIRRKTKKDEPGEEAAQLVAGSSPTRKRMRDMKDESGDESKHVNEENGTIVKKQDPPSDEENPSAKKQEDSEAEAAKPSVKGEVTKPEINEKEEYSDVIDEPPPTKRRKSGTKEASSKAKPLKSAPKKSAVSEDPKEAEIKKLQSQLSKCGVRKLWHMELRQHKDDAKAKIRHLKQMLADIGMDGRFSEAKAREIKEMRELRADVEAAQEMNRMWGKDSGGRASRSKDKDKSVSMEKKAESNAKDLEENGEEDEQTSFAARRRRAQAELAFLGEESDSY